MSSKQSNAYEILGITPDATADEVLSAYRRACMRVHPDRGGSVDDFLTLQRAFRALQNRVCPDCEGKGFITTRRGAFVDKTPCPKCWKT